MDVEAPPEPQQAPESACDCRAPRCTRPECQKCSSCGCDHASGEGDKTPRKRGRPPGSGKRKAQRPMETASPGSAMRQRSVGATMDREEVEIGEDGEIAGAGDDDEEVPSVLELMRVLGFGADKIDYVRKNMGSAALRQDPKFWELQHGDCTALEQRARSVIASLYMDILGRVGDSVCGPDAALGSINFLRQKFGTSPQESVKSETSSTCMQHIEPLVIAYVATKKGSLERRVIRAILSEAFKPRDLERAHAKFPRFNMSKSSYRNGKMEFTILCEDGVLVEEKSSRAKFDKAVADKAIQFILNPNNVSFLSYDGRRTKLDGAIIKVPSIRRNKPVFVMYKEYRQAQSEGEATLSSRTFYRMCNVLARGPEAFRGAADSVTRQLVDDSVDRINKIVQDNLPAERDTLERKLLLVKDWLKYACFAGDPLMMGCPRHDPSFGLTRSKSPSGRRISCAPCLMMHALFNYITARLEEVVVPATLTVLRHCIDKLEVYMGHQLRIVKQQTVIDDIADQMKVRCVSNSFSTEALVVIDFKGKVAPLFSREDESTNGGDTPFISWHSTMVRFWSVDESDRSNSIETKVYFDHVSQHREDKMTIVALVESVLVSIRRDLPHISSIVLQCDNASCYQNAVLPAILPLLGAANGLNVSRLIHTEAKNGASDLDTHIARALQRVSTWAERGNNCASAAQLVEALAADDGITNSVAQLVEYEGDALRQMSVDVEALERSFAAVVGSVNDILYEFPAQAPQLTEFKSSPSFRLRAFAYSGIDAPVTVEVNPVEGSCTVVDSNSQAPSTRIGSDFGDAGDERDANEDDSDGETDEAINNDTVDDLELEVEDEGETSREIVLPATNTAQISRAKVITIAQIRMRQHSWRAMATSTTFLPVSGPAPIEPQTEEKDIVAYTKRFFQTFNDSQHQVGVVAAISLTDQMLRLCEGMSFPSLDTRILSAGWACRPPRSTLYGTDYVTGFAADIDELHKLRPTKILETLQLKYPGRYDLPSLDDIKAMLKRQTNAGFTLALPSKPGRKPNKSYLNSSPENLGNGAEHTTSKRQRLDTVYASYLEGLVIEKPTVKPNDALQAFRARFPGSEAEAPDDRVKAKVSNLKSKDKRLNG